MGMERHAKGLFIHCCSLGMILYFSILFVCLLASFTSITKHSKMERLLIILLALFFCFGYMTGSDWRNYETYYSWLDDGGISLLMEPGYIYLSAISHSLGIPFWPFFITLKLLAFFCLLHFLRKYACKNQFLVITFFLFIFGLYLYIDNPMRNLLAISISYFAYQYLDDKKWIKFLGVVLLATFFHSSAILLLFLFPFYPIKLKNWGLFLLFVLFNIVIIFSYEFLIMKVIAAFSFIPIIEAKVIHYFIDGSGLENNRLISLGFIVQFAFFMLVLYKRKQIEAMPYGKLIFWGTICYIFLYRMAAIVSIFYRLQLYMSVFYAVGVCCVFSSLIKKGNKIAYGTFLVCYLSYMTYTLVISSYKYVPYTNYISYMFSPELPFDYRSEYNQVNSPYEKNTKETD